MRRFWRAARPHGWAFGLGAGTVFGFAPFGLYPLPVLLLAGLFWLVRADAPRAALLKGGSFGLGLFLAGVSWVYVSLHDFGMMPLPIAALATLLFCAYLALFPALAVGLAARLAPPGWLRLILALPSTWVLAEMLRGALFTGFPWQALGYSQAPASPLAGYVPLFGSYGASTLVALSAGLLAWGATRSVALPAGPGPVFAWRPARLPAVLLLVLWLGGAGLARVAWTEAEGETVPISLLQGNVEQDLKFEPGNLLATLTRYQHLLLTSTGRIVVTPETALPLFLEHIPEAYLDNLQTSLEARGASALVGLPVREADGRYFNSMLTLGQAIGQRYDKAHLVPFGEFIPPGFGWIVEWLKMPLSGFSAGVDIQPPLVVNGLRLAVNVCYEDVFGDALRPAVGASTVMVNVSNDAWFGQSFAPWQHLQISQMRALETGRPWLRANNTGITAIVDEKGQVTAALAPFREAILEGAVQGRTGRTPYVRWGDAPLRNALLLTLLLVWGHANRGKILQKLRSHA